MTVTIGFDVYGTLIDTHGVVDRLDQYIGEQAQMFSQAWRDKQLEYSFRRGLMRAYENFAVCTRQALDYTDALFRTGLTDEQKLDLMHIYSVLPAFDDVGSALATLQQSGSGLYAFSNGSAEAVETLLTNAGIRQYFIDVVSVDEIRSFKPDPDVYRHFMKRAHVTDDNVWLVSSNPFDVLGALSAGMKAAWVQRTQAAIFDPWDVAPTTIVSSLDQLANKLIDH
jgi:2-haloacid dehalogenase